MSEPEITTIMENILNLSIDDGVTLNLKGIEEIREEADYPGYRVSIEALFDKTRQTLKVDITTGDFVTPREIEYSFKLLFEDRAIRIMAYNLETVLAEKFETIITRGVTNTRMRDFYDIYILTTTQSFDDAIFFQALEKTVLKRGTIEQMSNPPEVIHTIATNELMMSLWQRYQKKYSYAGDISWEMVVRAISDLAMKLEMSKTH